MIPLHFITIQANKIVPSSKGLSAFLSPKLNFKVQLQETWLLSKIVQWFLSSGSYCCTAEKSLSIFWAPTIEKNTGWEYPAGVQRSPDWAMKAASPLAPPDRVLFAWCELLPLPTGSPEWNSTCLAIWGRFLLLRHNGAYPHSLPGLNPAVEEQPYGTGNWEKGRGQGREGREQEWLQNRMMISFVPTPNCGQPLLLVFSYYKYCSSGEADLVLRL